jgi:hypothetical protein
MKRRHFLKRGLMSLASWKVLGENGVARAEGAAEAAVNVENDCVKYVIAANGQNLHFIDKGTGEDYCARNPASAFSRVKKAGVEYAASAVSYAGGRMAVQFGNSGINAILKVTTEKHYLVFEVLSISDEHAEELIFLDLTLTLRGSPQEPFAVCALALNLETNVPAIPRASSRLQATCYPRFGFAGARVAIIGFPAGQLREVMKEVILAAAELPHSPLGGPWAMEAPINQGSYLFNFENLTEETVDAWIKLAQSLGFTQIDFHGGKSFRFGDFRPNPTMYPRGQASLKAVIDKLHAAGIAAGLHTYAFFMDKSCPWVTPVPDPRLAKDAAFTLAESLGPDDGSLRVAEPTKDMSAITGFFVRNSVTLRIDEELITYSGISKELPYAFTACRRGAYGTRAAPHAEGAKVYHLKECFGLFVPDGDSTLFSEVAARTAETFNECGFDMIYLDALDGEDILGGAENGWHYGSKFAFEIWKRLKKPALMEMSTFHHHLWFVRSRLEAWDHPRRSHKRFIDLHCAANGETARMFLPGELGWWAVLTWAGPQVEPTFADDIEYLCGKCLGTDTGLALMGVDPDSITKRPALERLATVFRNYETLRHAHYFPESVKAKLRAPGEEFALTQNAAGEWQFRPAQYVKHKVEGINGWSNSWRIRNPFRQQPLQCRIEALMSAGPYEAPGNITLANFTDPQEFSDRASAPGVSAGLQPSLARVKAGLSSACYTASNAQSHQDATWTKMGRIFSPPLDLSRHQALGVWVYGDGQGEVLNFQLRSPEHISPAIGEHYVVVDFTGWRYFELIEPEGERFAHHSWPYGSPYAIYRESVDYGHVEFLTLWYNHLPPKGPVSCYLSPIKALPLVKMQLSNPALTIGNQTIVFPGQIESGCYLEFHSPSDCKLYGSEGEVTAEVMPQGEVPILREGENEVKFACDVPVGVSARAKVMLVNHGEPLPRA